MGKILIYGAGAIGRGFLAPTFNRLGYDIFFVDKNPEVINELRKRNSYKTAFSKHDSYNLVKVNYSGAFFPGEEVSIIENMDFVFSCVGPKNIHGSLNQSLRNVPAIISFENEIESVDNLKNLTENENCYFGIPDVITSNDAPIHLKKIDPLCLVTEDGEFAIEKGKFEMPLEIPVYEKEDLVKYWNCKFYLHNTPHATAAFLGKLFGVTYLHEAMAIPIIEKVVLQTMDATKEAMKINGMAKSEFIDFYSQKEIGRFKDEFLFDPIARVGREPLRKLRNHDRLIQSAKFIENANQNANGAYLTIKAAIYDAIMNPVEACNISPNEMSEVTILNKISGLDKNDKIFQEITQNNIFQMLFKSLASKEIVANIKG